MTYHEWNEETHRLEMLQHETRMKLKELHRNRPEKPEPVPPGDLTWEEALECVNRGELLQRYCSHVGLWVDSEANLTRDILSLSRGLPYRRKPEPKRVPLGPEDVPPGSIVRWACQADAPFHSAGQSEVLMAIVSVTCVMAVRIEGCGWRTFQELHDHFEISRDGGKTWHGCWKEETNG